MYNAKNVSAYTILELMVVLTVLAILLMVSVSTYKSYIVKSRITTALTSAQQAAVELNDKYVADDMFPTNFSFNNVTVSNGDWILVDDQNIPQIKYSISSDGLGAMIQLTVKGLESIKGYVSPSASDGTGNASVFNYGLRNVNGYMEKVCGTSAPNVATDIPEEYLPTACNCANVSAFVLSNGSCN